MKLVIEISDRDAACLFKDEWDGQRRRTLKEAVEKDVAIRAAGYRAFNPKADLDEALRSAFARRFLPEAEAAPSEATSDLLSALRRVVSEARENHEHVPSEIQLERVISMGALEDCEAALAKERIEV